MPSGKDLLQDIETRRVEPGRLCFWWLGQHGFVVKTAGAVVYLDPFLSGRPDRLVPPLLDPRAVTHATVITGSHDHDDHVDDPSLRLLLEASPAAALVVPRAVRERLSSAGFPEQRLLGIDHGQQATVGPVRVTAVKAAHEFFDVDPRTGHPYLGFIVEADGVTIYHSGDTCVYDGMVPLLAGWRLDVAFLPINGRDGKRLRAGIIGNMTWQEAVDLAGSLRPRLTVPCHYDMFAGNTADPRLFAEYLEVKYPGLDCWIGPHGTPVEVEGGGAG